VVGRSAGCSSPPSLWRFSQFKTHPADTRVLLPQVPNGGKAFGTVSVQIATSEAFPYPPVFPRPISFDRRQRQPSLLQSYIATSPPSNRSWPQPGEGIESISYSRPVEDPTIRESRPSGNSSQRKSPAKEKGTGLLKLTRFCTSSFVSSFPCGSLLVKGATRPVPPHPPAALV